MFPVRFNARRFKGRRFSCKKPIFHGACIAGNSWRGYEGPDPVSVHRQTEACLGNPWWSSPRGGPGASRVLVGSPEHARTSHTRFPQWEEQGTRRALGSDVGCGLSPSRSPLPALALLGSLFPAPEPGRVLPTIHPALHRSPRWANPPDPSPPRPFNSHDTD